MKDYERITTRRDTPLTMSMWAGDSESLKVYNHLSELEDKIERGELVDRNEYLDRLMETKYISGMTNKELEFFAKHNARVRENAEAEIARLTAKMVTRDVEVCKEVVKKCLQVLRDMRTVYKYDDDYSRGWNKGIDQAIEQLAKKYYIDAEERE